MTTPSPAAVRAAELSPEAMKFAIEISGVVDGFVLPFIAQKFDEHMERTKRGLQITTIEGFKP